MKFPKLVVDYVEADHPRRVTEYFGDIGTRDWREVAETIAAEQMADIQPWLQGVKTSLDIGCGLAGLSIMLGNRSGVETVHLVDGGGGVSSKVGFGSRLPWSDVAIAAALARANLTGTKVVAYRADDLPGAIPADLIVSMKSWGHHYPVGVYADFARRSLNPGGIAVLDIRRGSGGFEEMEAAGFVPVGKISETPKSERFAFR
ncbi:MAG: hypothetical protein ACYCZ0_00100 [Minisyncoccota bacterium]